MQRVADGLFVAPNPRVILPLLALALFALLFTDPLLASDNNEKPPYMIYIDPVTGKYTTEAPSSRAESAAIPEPAIEPKASRSAEMLTGLLLLLVVTIYVIRARPGKKPASPARNTGR